jgi:hypothetical protein
MKKNALLIILGIAVACLFARAAFAAPQATGAKRPLLEGAPADIVPWVADPNQSDTFSFQVLTQPTNGAAAAVSSGQELQYTPDSGFTSGTDSYTYSATDQNGNSVNGKARVRVYDGSDTPTHTSALTICTRNGTLADDGSGMIGVRSKSNDCTFYSRRRTRVTPAGTPVTVDFFVNWPSDSSVWPKGVVILIGGGDFNMGFSGDTVHGVPDETSGKNFVVRTAQLFANAGYITIALNKPSDVPSAGTVCTGAADDPCQAQADQYRVSTNHAVDILKILNRFNTLNLPVFLAGTSKGALSAVAQNLIATGISLSSTVTNNTGSPSYLYVGDPAAPNLSTVFVKRPVHVLWNTSDLCGASPPSGSSSLYAVLLTTTAASSSTVTGGLRVTTPGNGLTSSNIGFCQPFDYHGYFGIEATAVGTITAWLDGRVGALGGTTPPNAPFGKAQVASGGMRQFNLKNITGNPAGVVYGLSNGVSSLGGSITINGQKVTYTAPTGVSNETDYFVYTVTGPQGAVGAGIITIKIN